MIPRIFLICFIVLISMSARPAVSEQSVDVVTFEYYPIVKPDTSGIGLHVVKAACDAMGVTAHIRLYPRIRSMKMFEDSNHLLFLGEARYFPKLKGRLVYQKYLNFRVVLLYKKSRFRSLEHGDVGKLKNKVLGVSLGSNLTPVFKSKGWIVHETAHLENNVHKLMSDRIDFWGTVCLSGMQMIRDMYPRELDNTGLVEIETFPIHAVAKKGTPSEKNLILFQKGLRLIIENGTYRKVLELYYGNDVPESVPVSLIDIQS